MQSRLRPLPAEFQLTPTDADTFPAELQLTPTDGDTIPEVWTVLGRRYDEVRAAGLWLWRKDARKDELFPSLYAAERPTQGRRRKVATDEAADLLATPSAGTTGGKAPSVS